MKPKGPKHAVNAEEFKKRAKEKVAEIERRERDPRFEKTMGTLVRLRLLTHPRIRPYRGVVTLEDALWAGELEPRVYELLPAVLLRRPKVFPNVEPLPDDLNACLRAIQRGEAPGPFRGIPARNFLKWVTRLGRTPERLPTRLKAFRFSSDDQARLSRLTSRLSETETGVLRQALEVLEKKVGQ